MEVEIIIGRGKREIFLEKKEKKKNIQDGIIHPINPTN